MEVTNRIITLSNPTPVSMADSWYQHGTSEHFWVRHRNVVFDRHFSPLIRNVDQIGEVGCGHGLMLHHIAETHRKPVDGFELNLMALELCPPVPGNLYVYDILSRSSELVNKYDVLILMDVIEHIEEEVKFLEAVRDHLKVGGFVIVGVPMRQHLYSAYDEADGHFRRYSSRYLRSVIECAGFQVQKVVEWGHVYIPLLMMRKLMLQNSSGSTAIQKGFAVSKPLNQALSLLKYLDFIPTFNLTGASSLVLAQKL